MMYTVFYLYYFDSDGITISIEKFSSEASALQLASELSNIDRTVECWVEYPSGNTVKFK